MEEGDAFFGRFSVIATLRSGWLTVNEMATEWRFVEQGHILVLLWMNGRGGHHRHCWSAHT